MTRWIQNFALAVILFGLTATHARASLVISLSNATVAPNGMGTMNIFVTSNSSDTLSSFNLELQVAPISATSILQFASTQPIPYLNPSYVFFGQSLNADLSLPLWSVPSPLPNPFVAITGGDLNDGSGLGFVTVGATAGGPDTFLASVEFQAARGATLGDTFRVSLVSNSNTFFDDKNGAPLGYTVNPVGGVVSIASIPEPTSLAMATISSLGGLLWYCGRRRRKPSQSSSG